MTTLGFIKQPFSQTQRLAFFTLCVVGSATMSHKAKPSTLALVLALGGIAVAIWHGAFDGILARPVLRPRFGSRWSAVFVGGYLVLVATVAGLWWLAPSVTLPLFLIYSAWHFGTEAYEGELSFLPALQAFSVGFVPIAASCYWHPEQVDAIFSLMLRSSAPFAAKLTEIGGAALLTPGSLSRRLHLLWKANDADMRPPCIRTVTFLESRSPNRVRRFFFVAGTRRSTSLQVAPLPPAGFRSKRCAFSFAADCCLGSLPFSALASWLLMGHIVWLRSRHRCSS